MGFRFTLVALLCGMPLLAQRTTGEIRLHVKDQIGEPVAATGLLESLATGVRRAFQAGPQGAYTFRGLPFGPYSLRLERDGFAGQVLKLEIRSEAPVERAVTMGVAPVETSVTVRDADTLTDPRSTAASRFIGPDTLEKRQASTPGRSAVDLVNAQPGWLLEANGVLHPRGSEYDVQYVIDGIPLYDNRSPAFAQSLGIDEFESMTIRTAGFPAEFGRKLGGVIEVATAPDAPAGWHGSAAAQGGSFAQTGGFASVQYAHGKNAFGVSGEGFSTDRYLDAPVLENYTNHGSGGAASARWTRKWSDADSTRFYSSTRHTGFLVPNELLQEAAGQRQDRTAGETMGHVSHTHVFSPRVLGQARLMVRDTSAALWSNPLSTPILPTQDRGFREAYAGASVSVNLGAHELKAGGEALFTNIHENFAYRIATYTLGDVPVFDPEVPAEFQFASKGKGRDQSAYLQDLWRLGRLTISAGLRFDHHKLVLNETGWSPRLGVAYSLPRAGVVLRASYDRVFQVPSLENVLLASTDLVERLGGEGAFLPLRSARGNYFEAGFTKGFFGKLRLDGTWYRRKIENFADDNLLLNTGVSFPIAFREVEVHGYEAKVEVPRWGRFSGYVSYSNLFGFGRLPVAGGLFLGDDASELLTGTEGFAITQDQRNSIRARIRVEAHRRLWFALSGAYNSGLPFEVEGPQDESLIASQYGARILSKVNYDRGRVRPSASINASVGADVLKRDKVTVRFQADAFNLGDRLNLINFSGVLSGTAVEAGRNFAARMTLSF